MTLIDDDGKKCSICGVKKPYEEFDRRARMPDGLNGFCKACRREYQNISGRNKRNKVERFCISCKTTKPISEFYKRSDGSTDGYHNVCKECKKKDEYRKRVDNMPDVYTPASVDKSCFFCAMLGTSECRERNRTTPCHQSSSLYPQYLELNSEMEA